MRRLFSTQFLWLAARLFGACAGLIFQLCLARILTPRDLGIFFSASSLAAILGIIATQGYPYVAARFVSRYAKRQRTGWLIHFLSWTQSQIVLSSTFLGIVFIGIALTWPGFEASTRSSFVLAGVCVPAMSILTLLAAVGVAKRQFLAGLLPDLLLRPFLLATFAGGTLLLHGRLTVAEVMLAFVVFALGVAALQLMLIRPVSFGENRRSRLSMRWRREAWTLLPVMLFTSFFGDLAIVCATPFLKAVDLAAFGLTIKMAMIVGFGVQIAHQILLPDLSDAFARRRTAETKPILLKGALFPIAFSATASLITFAFGPSLLRLYGPQFEYASGPLVLLVSCQLVRALGGPSQSVLTLHGRQSSNLLICVLAGLILVFGNFLMPASYGLWGAAIVATASYSFWVSMSCVALRVSGDVQTDLLALVGPAAFAKSTARPA